jgi:outer membrane protein OmpA-like peptidoglycan-associated protein
MKRTVAWLLGTSLSLAACSPQPSRPGQAAQAQNVAGLFPTGVDDSGNVLAIGTVDPHYTLSFSSDAAFPAPASAFVCDLAGWVADDTTAEWISIQTSDVGNDDTYTYRQTFTFSGDPTTASMTGSWAADDTLSLFINGSTTAAAQRASPAYGSLATFTVASPGLVVGTNTLDFQTINSGGGPTGLRVEALAVSAYCTTDAQCVSGWCFENILATSNTCNALIANGVAIVTDLTHSPALGPLCNATTGSTECAAGVCGINNLCGIVNGGACVAGASPSKCQSNTCSVDGTCIAAGSCDVDGDCMSTQWCDAAAHTCNAKGNTGTPIPGAGTCTAGATDRCLSGTCATALPVDLCGYANGTGPCTTGNAGGTSGVCQSGICDPTANAGAGLCEQCTSTQLTNCGVLVPICDSVTETCVACNGDNGTTATATCGPTTPYCPGGGAACGACGTAGLTVTCTAAGALHAGTTCQPSGACSNLCLIDGDCAMDQWCPSNGTTPEACETDLANGTPIPTLAGHVPTLNGMCPGTGLLSICASGVCDTDGECGYQDGDGSCTTGTAMKVCRSGVCGANLKCRPANGCNTNGDCSGGATCNASFLCQLPPPVITAPFNGATIPTGPETVTGTGIPGDVVVVSLDGVVVGTVTVDSAGNWSLTVTLPNAGAYTISAVQQPAMGSSPLPSVPATIAVNAANADDDMSPADLAGADLAGADLAGSPDFAQPRAPSFAGGGLTCEMGGHGAGSASELFWFGLLCAIAFALRQRVRPRRGRFVAGTCVAILAFAASTARAEDHGFTIGRYEPTSAGEWSFAVDHPWYSSTRFFAGGFTLDYAHNPLVAGFRNADGTFTETSAVVAHALIGHFDLAASFLDRVTVSFSLPVIFLERGNAIDGVAPLAGAGIGDPRLGIMVRLYGQPDRSGFSLSLGGWVWIPIGRNDDNTGDSGVRVLPKLVAAGYGHHVRYSGTFGFLYRPPAVIGALPAGAGNTVGSEIQFGALVQYADQKNRFAIGPEATLATVVNDGHAFHKSWTSLEMLLGVHYNVARQLQLGLAAGIGLLREPGTPDFRALFRIAYAPIRTAKAKPIVVVEAPPPPPPDRDHDGVPDADDQCPDVPKGERPDPDRLGCPMGDRDKDGVLDGDDQCPDEPSGLHPDPKRPGCPAVDTDGDGIYDPDDVCPNEKMGEVPDPKRLGCPLPDRDGDRVADADDACPDEAGAPSPDPKKNGCPGLVTIKNGQVVILQPVYFATGKDVILPRSFPVLQAVADALIAQPSITHIAIEGHTDDRGKPSANLALSDRRARSVMRFLIAHEVQEGRLDAQGFGQTHPISTNRTAAGRAVNRRVEFHILDGQ